MDLQDAEPAFSEDGHPVAPPTRSQRLAECRQYACAAWLAYLRPTTSAKARSKLANCIAALQVEMGELEAELRAGEDAANQATAELRESTIAPRLAELAALARRRDELMTKLADPGFVAADIAAELDAVERERRALEPVCWEFQRRLRAESEEDAMATALQASEREEAVWGELLAVAGVLALVWRRYQAAASATQEALLACKTPPALPERVRHEEPAIAALMQVLETAPTSRGGTPP